MINQQLNGQIRDLTGKAQKILITTKKQASIDGLAGSLGLFLAIKKLGKAVDLIIDDFNCPENLSFLPNVQEIKTEAKRLKKVTISLDISQNGLESLYYDIQNGFLRVHLTPKQGVINPDSLAMETSEFAYDLIITVDCPEIESLGKLYDQHRDLFYQTPVINIDHSMENEQYGHLNLIDLTAVAGSEIIFNLLKNWPEQLLDKEIATCLLTGLIAKTKSFKTANVTPETLKIAGELIDWGADRKNIVTKLYQTKTISALKLWGKILSRLQLSDDGKLLWSKINSSDLIESGASEKDADNIIEELIAYHPFAKVIIIFSGADNNKVKVLLETQGTLDALMLSREFGSTGDKNRVTFYLAGELNDLEKKVINAITAKLQAVS